MAAAATQAAPAATPVNPTANMLHPIDPALLKKARRPDPPKFDTPEAEHEFKLGRVAAAYRIVALQKLETGNETWISWRDSLEPGTYWIKPAGMANSLVKVSDLLKVDESGKVLNSDGKKTVPYDAHALSVHLAVYKSRKDVNAVVQCYTAPSKSFTVLNDHFDMILQDNCNFHNQLFFSPLSDLVETDDGALNATQLAGRLGEKGRVLLLQDRGLLTTGGTVDSVIANLIKVNNICHVQLLADTAARSRGETTVLIDMAEIEYTAALIASDLHSWLHGLPYFQQVEEDLKSDHRK